MDNVKTSQVPLFVHNHPRPAHVSPTGDHDHIPWLKLDMVDNLVLNKIEFDSIVYFDSRVGITDSPAVVGDNVRNGFGAKLVFTHFAEFESSFFRADPVDGEAPFDVVQ